MGFVRRVIVLMMFLMPMLWLVYHVSSSNNNAKADTKDEKSSDPARQIEEVEPDGKVSDEAWDAIKDDKDWEQVGSENDLNFDNNVDEEDIETEEESVDLEEFVPDEEEDRTHKIILEEDELEPPAEIDEEIEANEEIEEAIEEELEEEIEKEIDEEDKFKYNKQFNEFEEDNEVLGLDDEFDDNEGGKKLEEDEEWLKDDEPSVPDNSEKFNIGDEKEEEEMEEFEKKLFNEENNKNLKNEEEIEEIESKVEEELEEEELLHNLKNDQVEDNEKEFMTDVDDEIEIEKEEENKAFKNINKEQELFKAEANLEKEEEIAKEKVNNIKENTWMKEIEEEEEKEEKDFGPIEDNNQEADPIMTKEDIVDIEEEIEELQRNNRDNQLNKPQIDSDDEPVKLGVNLLDDEAEDDSQFDKLNSNKNRNENMEQFSPDTKPELPIHEEKEIPFPEQNKHITPDDPCHKYGNQLTPANIPQGWLNKKNWLREIAESGLLPVEQSLRSLSLVLVAASKLTTGPIVEFGYGVYSTPVLARIGRQQNRYVMSTGTDQERLDRFQQQLDWKCHDFVFIDEDQPASWEKIGNDAKWSLVIVHQNPQEKRTEDLLRMADHAEVLIAPDYEYKEEHKFNHVYRWTLVKPHVTIMSNSRPDVVEGIKQMLTWIEEVFCPEMDRGECFW